MIKYSENIEAEMRKLYNTLSEKDRGQRKIKKQTTMKKVAERNKQFLATPQNELNENVVNEQGQNPSTLFKFKNDDLVNYLTSTIARRKQAKVPIKDNLRFS